MIPAETLEILREGSQDVFFILIPHHHNPTSGGNHSTRCPLGTHEDTQASFSWNGDRGMWNCFACGARGDVFKLVMELEGLGFKAAVHRVAELTQREVDLGGKRPFNPERASREKVIRANRRAICDGLRRWHREMAIHYAKQCRFARESLDFQAETLQIAAQSGLEEGHWLWDVHAVAHARAGARLEQYTYLADQFAEAAHDIELIGRLFAQYYAPTKF